MTKKKPNKATRELMSRMVDDGCILCESPAEIHHLLGAGMGLKSKEFIALCPFHHRLGGIGNAVHSGTETWEGIHGTQKALLKLTMERLGL